MKGEQVLPAPGDETWPLSRRQGEDHDAPEELPYQEAFLDLVSGVCVCVV